MRRRAFLGALLGAAAGPPLTASAQPTEKGARRRIAIAHLGGTEATVSDGGAPRWRAFFAELRQRGYAVDKNLVVERVAIERAIWQSIIDLVSRAEVAVVDSSEWAGRINNVTSRIRPIPIVALVTNPLGEGLTSSLATPGDNITGIVTDTGPALLGKQLEFLLEAVPRVRHLACLGAGWPNAAIRTLLTDAQRRGVTVQEFVVHAQFHHVSRESNYDDAFSALLRDGAEAVLVLDDPEHLSHAATIAELSLRHRLPVVSPFRTLAEAGGLMSYGPDWDELERRRAVYVARILDGARPQELPFEQPSRLQFVLNLKTAQALGLTIPPTLLARADEVIE